MEVALGASNDHGDGQQPTTELGPSLHARPNLIPRIADSNDVQGIAVKLDIKLDGMADQIH